MSNVNQDGYGNLPPMQETQKPGGCNPIFLIVIAIGIFFLLNAGLGNRPANVEPNGDNWEEPTEQLPKGSQGIPADVKRTGASDWEMQELDATPSADPSSDSNKSRPSKTSDGDWSIEEVDTKSDQGVELKTKNSPKPKSKKTSKGDWEFEEVGKGK